MPKKKVNTCMTCGRPVFGRTYRNARYCRDCVESRTEYNPEYKRKHDRRRYLFNMIAGVGIALAYYQMTNKGGKKVC